ncbi:hypothetical protein ACIF80_33865 [Streptomyces sp. NPDC085927]|uniref:hypothetical protein n=1 Tax=Streptomyces sp. NPDC085927 TaxID=3365738 RepID=UPI0037CF9DC9
MSVVALHRLVRDVERQETTRARLLADPDDLLAEYPLTEAERTAVLDLDASTLVELGVHPLVMRTLLVTAGVPNPDLYTHDRGLRG